MGGELPLLLTAKMVTGWYLLASEGCVEILTVLVHGVPRCRSRCIAGRDRRYSP